MGAFDGGACYVNLAITKLEYKIKSEGVESRMELNTAKQSEIFRAGRAVTNERFAPKQHGRLQIPKVNCTIKRHNKVV